LPKRTTAKVIKYDKGLITHPRNKKAYQYFSVTLVVKAIFPASLLCSLNSKNNGNQAWITCWE